MGQVNRFPATVIWYCGLLLTLLGIWSCGKQSSEESPAISYPEETARLVSEVTAGIISATDIIRVRFSTPVVGENLVGQPVAAPVFRFTPNIDGAAYWENAQTLAFRPNRPLTMRQRYSGTLDIAALLPTLKERGPEPLAFAFEVAGREIADIETDFVLENENDPRRLLAKGTVSFTVPTQAEILRSAAVLRKNGTRLDLSWQEANNGKTFHFTSESIARTAKTQRFILTLSGSPLALTADFTRTFELPPLTDLSVEKVIASKEGSQPNLTIRFSDDLDPRQDVTGLVSVTPALNFQLKKMGKTLILSGDFQHGQTYAVTVQKGIRSRFGTEINATFTEDVTLAELKPQLKFASDGAFLTSANQRKVRFLTLNLRKVQLNIKKVFDNNLGQFLQTEALSSLSKRNQEFNNGYVSRVGISVVDRKLEIGEARNEWQQHELDLSGLIQPNDKGLYLLSLSFDQEDMLYGDPEEYEGRSGRYYYGEDYYSNPYSRGYIYANGRIFKPLILSDIGLTYKKAYDRHIVFATDLLSAQPLSGVTVHFKTYQNQLIKTVQTDVEGRAELKASEQQNVFFIEAEKGGQRSVIKPTEMAWNLSTFDTEGVDDPATGTRAFIYTERGVYRPGDPVNLSAIARNDDGTFPEDHPVTLQIFNPLRQKVFDQTLRQSQDGFYHFTYQGGSEDPTGNYRVSLEAGSRTFDHTLKIETVAPFRLKVNLEPGKSLLTRADRYLTADLNSTYLFGSPAAGLSAEVQVKLLKKPLTFSSFRTFSFDNQTIDFQPIEATVFSGQLSGQGTAGIRWELPALEKAPTTLRARLNARVLEKGGRPNLATTEIPIHPYDRYVGIETPDFDWGYAKVGAEVPLRAVLVTPEGAASPGHTLNYRIYHGERYWWWEYDNRDDFLLRFKSHSTTELAGEGAIISQSLPADFSFVPENDGTYFIEVQDGESGHTAGIFLNAYGWGDAAGGADAGILAMKTDRDRYLVGETATVSFPAPRKGRILVTLEKGKRVLSTGWLSPTGEEIMSIPIELTEEMVPTSYLSISVIQPHAQTANDRPIRMYGVAPLNIENRASRQSVRLTMPETLRSKEKFTVEVQTSDRKPTQFTIATVDEGLLALTNYQTPDPWQHFFQKLRLGVETYDLFNQVIGANKGDVFQVFSIGGGMDDAYRKSQLSEGKKQRFKPVSLFKGPMMTDENGRATVEYEMPNYVGAVRIMVVNASGNRFGSTEKTVPVKTELMVMPTLPRVLGPGDEISLPVTVFAMADNLGEVQVKVDVEGPLAVLDAPLQTLRFAEAGESDLLFRLKAREAIGEARVSISATAGRYAAESVTDIAVRPASPRIFESRTQPLTPGETVNMVIPGRGIPGSNRASISVSRRPNLNFAQRLLFLIRYPYGCIEQTTSAVFPQLYLKEFLKDTNNGGKLFPRDAQSIDRNIDAGIRRLQRFKLPSGGFSYWPGERSASPWGNNYAGHFLLEARKLGYAVPDDLLRGWIKYQQTQANSTREDLMTRTYRVYLLALAGEPVLGPMNLLRENNLKDMSNTEKWLLAGAYHLAGQSQTAAEITRDLDTAVRDYWEFGNTYGSTLRDQAIILEMQRLFENWNQADAMADQISAAMADGSWYSTQTTAFSLLALGKYLQSLSGASAEKPRLAGTVALPGGESIAFDSDEWILDYPIATGFGEALQVRLDEKSTVKRAFATISWDGIPLVDTLGDTARNIALNVAWLNDDGQPIDPARLQQGQSFWAHYRVKNTQRRYGTIAEVALVQVLPAGWEIENTRLSGETMPGWAERFNLNREEYLDIRDDRVMWFFDLRGYDQPMDFLVKLNAVTVGEFVLPGTVCEAMYNDHYKARKAGGKVIVSER